MSSVLLSVVTVGAGVFTVALGIVHLSIPKLVGYRAALVMGGSSGATVPAAEEAVGASIGWSRRSYRVRPTDLLGITWVMSNAASYVLITIGVLDLAWAAGWRGIPIAIGATWIAGWWAIRAASQFTLGRRIGDVLAAVWFAALGAGHLVLALGLD